MRQVLADLHIHTVLSPCGEIEMIPPLIVQWSREAGTELIAITDHNAGENCQAVMRAGLECGLTVLPGMEAQSSEEVHVLCLFDTVEQVLTWQGIVFDHLPQQQNPESVLGPQYVVDAEGEYIRTEPRLLLASTDLSLAQIVERVQALGGVAIPAHIDRPSFSLLANLGFVPPDLHVPALEIFRLTDPSALVETWPDLAARTLIKGSDAHCLSDLKPRLRLNVEAPTVAELALALAGAEGRSVELIGAGPV